MGHPAALEALAENTLPHVFSLKVLVLRFCGIGFSSMVALGRGLPFVQRLEELHLGENRGLGADSDASFQVEGLQKLRSVKVLDLSYCNLTFSHVQGLGMWLQKLESLQKLRLDNNPILGNES